MDSYTVNTIDPIKGTINVTFTVSGTDYVTDIPITPYTTLAAITKQLNQQLADIQAEVALFDQIQGSISQATMGATTASSLM